jgi:hypothetical protein
MGRMNQGIHAKPELAKGKSLSALFGYSLQFKRQYLTLLNITYIIGPWGF